jgi:hypothetical protein
MAMPASSVLYQRQRAGEPDRSNTTLPNACLVVAEGTTIPQLTVGLGTGNTWKQSTPPSFTPVLPSTVRWLHNNTTPSSIAVCLHFVCTPHCAVHPNCRVSHYGFKNDDPGEGWTNTNWTAYSASNKVRLARGMGI